MQNYESWGIKGQIAKKCKIKRVVALTGGWRVDCENKVQIKRIAKKGAKLRGLGH